MIVIIGIFLIVRNSHTTPPLHSGFLGSVPADRQGHLDPDLAGGLHPLRV